jgi:predicted nucleic acid-binding protein
MKKPIRIYTDTSVFGGVFDTEFALHSEAFFQRMHRAEFEVVISPLVVQEMREAPERVREFFEEFRPMLSFVRVSDEAYALQSAYLKAGVVGNNSEMDALHVSVATVAGCKAIVSWNFKHIVNFRRIPLYNGVNESQGYSRIAIHSPAELAFDGKD